MTSPDEPDTTAAELALGVLEGDERTTALRRMLAEPDFAREVERWRNHFAALYAEIPAVQPGAALERRVAAIPARAVAPARWWPPVAALAAIAASVLLAIVLARPGSAPIAPATVRPTPLLVAVIKPNDAEPFAAVFDPASRLVTLRGGIAVPAERAAELWAIGADGVPHAAGMLGGAAGTRLALAQAITVGPGTTLAISIEPPGGSPRPTPTGPVVATGTLAAI